MNNKKENLNRFCNKCGGAGELEYENDKGFLTNQCTDCEGHGEFRTLSNPDCKKCLGGGMIGTYYFSIDDNDFEPCACVEENRWYNEHKPTGHDLL